MSFEQATEIEDAPEATGDLLGTIAAVARHVVTGRAAADFVRGGYERAFDIVPIPQRKRWGAAMRALESGWDDLELMKTASAAIDEIMMELVCVSKGMKKTIGTPLVLLTSGLTLLVVAQHAARRRVRELRDAPAGAGAA
jgi:hypothetical protein